MRTEEAADGVGYGKPPLTRRFKKGQTGNPDGRIKEYRPPFDPGMILQRIESEKISVLSNGKRKHMSKLEVRFRQLFNRAAAGETEAAKSILSMAKRYFAPEHEDDVEQVTLIMTARQAAQWQKKSKRRQAPEFVSSSRLFCRIAKEHITIEIEGRRVRRTIFEGILRQLSTMALNRDIAASNLLEGMRKQFPCSQRRVEELIFTGTEEDMEL